MPVKDSILSDRPTVAEIRPMKEAAKSGLKDMHAFPKSYNHLALVAVRDTEKRDFILQGLSAIGICAIAFGEAEEIAPAKHTAYRSEIHPNELFGFDFFLFDGEDERLDIVKAMKAGVVPVMPEKNVFMTLLKPFNPMKFEGNGFFFAHESPFAMFASCVSYVENSKFPEDRRILMKHVLETF